MEYQLKLKALEPKRTDILHEMCSKVWTTEVWLHDWTGIIGTIDNCANYRTISVMSHADGEVFYIIYKKLKQYLHSQIHQEQAGFMSGRANREQRVTDDRKNAMNTTSPQSSAS